MSNRFHIRPGTKYEISMYGRIEYRSTESRFQTDIVQHEDLEESTIETPVWKTPDVDKQTSATLFKTIRGTVGFGDLKKQQKRFNDTDEFSFKGDDTPPVSFTYDKTYIQMLSEGNFGFSITIPELLSSMLDVDVTGSTTYTEKDHDDLIHSETVEYVTADIAEQILGNSMQLELTLKDYGGKRLWPFTQELSAKTKLTTDSADLLNGTIKPFIKINDDGSLDISDIIKNKEAMTFSPLLKNTGTFVQGEHVSDQIPTLKLAEEKVIEEPYVGYGNARNLHIRLAYKALWKDTQRNKEGSFDPVITNSTDPANGRTLHTYYDSDNYKCNYEADLIIYISLYYPNQIIER